MMVWASITMSAAAAKLNFNEGKVSLKLFSKTDSKESIVSVLQAKCAFVSS